MLPLFVAGAQAVARLLKICADDAAVRHHVARPLLCRPITLVARPAAAGGAHPAVRNQHNAGARPATKPNAHQGRQHVPHPARPRPGAASQARPTARATASSDPALHPAGTTNPDRYCFPDERRTAQSIRAGSASDSNGAASRSEAAGTPHSSGWPQNCPLPSWPICSSSISSPQLAGRGMPKATGTTF
jgi:hypothetical protein